MSQFYPNPQSYVNPPQRPRKKIRPWMWITGSVLIFVGLLVWGAVTMGQRFGAEMHKGMEQAQQNMDSLQHTGDSLRNLRYADILDLETSDSAYIQIQDRVERLREYSNKIRSLFQSSRDSFVTSLPDSSTITMLNTELSRKYFIASNRAKMLKNALSIYEQRVREDLPQEIADDSTTVFALNDVMQNVAPDMFKKLLSWENLNFNQPPSNVLMNFRMIMRQIDEFEDYFLEQYAHLPTPQQITSDSLNVN